MRTSLLVALVFAASSAVAGDIDMGLTNPPAAAPAAAPSGSAPKAAGSGLKALDASLAQADAAAKELAQVLASAETTLKTAPKDSAFDYRKAFLQKTGDDCRAGFRASDLATAALDHGLGRPVGRYLACQAAASKQPAACTSHPSYSNKAPLGGGESAAQNCLDAYYMVRFAEGGDQAGTCKQANTARGGAGNPAVTCAALAAGKCDGAVALSWQPFEDEAHCLTVLAALRGDAAAVARGKKYDGLEFGYVVADVAAVAAARKGGSCGGSALCAAAVAGKAEACAPLFASVRDSYCETMVKMKSGRDSALLDAAAKEWREKNPQPRTAAMNTVVEKRKSVDAMLVALGVALDGYEPKTETGFGARVTRYRDIRRKVDADLKRFKTATEPPKPAPKPR